MNRKKKNHIFFAFPSYVYDAAFNHRTLSENIHKENKHDSSPDPDPDPQGSNHFHVWNDLKRIYQTIYLFTKWSKNNTPKQERALQRHTFFFGATERGAQGEKAEDSYHKISFTSVDYELGTKVPT